MMNAKKYELKSQNNSEENSKFHRNGNFDFLTICHKIKFDEPVIHFHSCNPASL